MWLIDVTLGARRASPLLAVTGLLALAGCGASPPPAAAPTPYQQALNACEDQAEYHFKEEATSQGANYTGDTDYQIVDPCMKAKGFEPPPH